MLPVCGENELQTCKLSLHLPSDILINITQQPI